VARALLQALTKVGTAQLSYDPPLANVDDFAIPQCVPDTGQAIAVIREHFLHWRSRSVGICG
jgi:hypothetical protein